MRSSYGDAEDLVWLNHEGIIAETEKATLFDLGSGIEKWIPKSVIVDWGEDLVGIKQWWAEKNDLKSVY